MTAIDPCACPCGIPVRKVLRLACCKFSVELMNFKMTFSLRPISLAGCEDRVQFPLPALIAQQHY